MPYTLAPPLSLPPDFLINVQILLWGAKHIGPPNAVTALRMDTDPAATWRDMAIRHARATAKNHLRPDGTSYHIVEYNPENRPPFINKRYTYQGYADESVWARGQSWALLGFAQIYSETRLPEFLDTARKVTDKWLELLATQPGAPSYVPIWDFRAPYKPEQDGPRDSSAAGIASLALLTLAEAVGVESECGQRYLCAAVRTLQALASPTYLAQPGEAFSALFKHAVSNFPDNYGVDVGIIYGDYYGLSAFTKCASMEACRSYVL
jgi:unsaturated chondroitin disaccharide hydrolase